MGNKNLHHLSNRSNQANRIIIPVGGPSMFAPRSVFRRSNHSYVSPYYYTTPHGHIHVSNYVPYVVGVFLLAASIAFLAALVLPMVAKVLLSLVLIAGAVTLGAAAYRACTR